MGEDRKIRFIIMKIRNFIRKFSDFRYMFCRLNKIREKICVKGKMYEWLVVAGNKAK